MSLAISRFLKTKDAKMQIIDKRTVTMRAHCLSSNFMRCCAFGTNETQTLRNNIELNPLNRLKMLAMCRRQRYCNNVVLSRKNVAHFACELMCLRNSSAFIKPQSECILHKYRHFAWHLRRKYLPMAFLPVRSFIELSNAARNLHI